jgi:hypothetical protein
MESLEDCISDFALFYNSHLLWFVVLIWHGRIEVGIVELSIRLNIDEKGSLIYR